MNRVSIYDPFADVFPTLFRSFFAEPLTGDARASGANGQAAGMRVDVTERSDAYVVTADLPGVKKDDINVEIDGNRVTIRAEVKHEKEVKGANGKHANGDDERVLRRERYVGQFVRSFQLADELDDEKAAAKYENGVLMLTLPKRQAANVKRLTIN
ncbi:MAG TPA: Hsp20/alpha crystallin family protein [Burkholderiaceae bacterium]|nr:Hsp20/alpha crystallin family protein [Burkholderiaceae bacterium]